MHLEDGRPALLLLTAYQLSRRPAKQGCFDGIGEMGGKQTFVATCINGSSAYKPALAAAVLYDGFQENASRFMIKYDVNA